MEIKSLLSTVLRLPTNPAGQESRGSVSPPSALSAAAIAADRLRLLSGLMSNFDAIDQDRDGTLSQVDLRIAANSPDSASVREVAMAALDSKDSAIVEWLHGGATRDTLQRAVVDLAMQIATAQILQQDRAAQEYRQEQQRDQYERDRVNADAESWIKSGDQRSDDDRTRTRRAEQWVRGS